MTEKPQTSITYQPIGIIHSPFNKPEGTPIQPKAAAGVKGSVEIFHEYEEGLKDLDGFSHIILIYHFHRIIKSSLIVTPFMDQIPHGVFATRAPSRPNPIGVSVVKLKSVEKNILYVEIIDVLDGTPLLDIKPYVSDFDYVKYHRKGWLEDNIGKLASSSDDGRFTE